MVSKELKDQLDKTDKLVNEVRIKLNDFDESTWLAKKLIKYKDESYLSAFIDFISRECDVSKVTRRFFRKRYFMNIYNAIVDNGQYDYYKMSRSFDYELVGKIIPNVIKQVSEYCDTIETPLDGKPLQEAFDDLLETGKLLMQHMESEDEISLEMDKLSWEKDREQKLELAQKHADVTRDLYRQYWNKLWNLLPSMRI